MSDELSPVKHDLETSLEQMLDEARALRQRVEFLESSKKEISELTDENKTLKLECDELQAKFVQALLQSRAQDDQQNLQRLLDTYKADLEKLKEALPKKPGEDDKKADSAEAPKTGEKPKT
jgi:hypothetical protein